MNPIYVRNTDKYGRGIYAARDIKTGELFEVSPVLISPQNEWEYIEKTVLVDYCFTWGKNYKQTAIALGYGSLFNHSYTPNAVFVYNVENLSIDFYAITNINRNEEITINYNCDPEDKSAVWFEVIDYIT
ncbi:SET domain-containing protein [Domibacillus sp. 8LH]|uniref:SET domain-containing protein n=1 Tax=Domibacillus sp. 8LH TaxID=3073900 RepID=UPI00317B7DBB